MFALRTCTKLHMSGVCGSLAEVVRSLQEQHLLVEVERHQVLALKLRSDTITFTA